MDEEIFEVEQIEEIMVEVEESAGWVSSENVLHSTLPDRNDPSAHEIGAINGLEDRLTNIEKPKTVYSDGYNIANYYKWKGSEEVGIGRFVSLMSDSEIVLCNGLNSIFGVTVDAAGFVGRQDVLVPKETDDSYKLVATSGHALVKYESGVDIDDYVVSNTSGYAKKSGSGRGYKVFAFADVNGANYAVISLDIQGDTIDKIGAEVNYLDTRLGAAETNITAANNVAQEALGKVNDIDSSKLVTSDKLEAIEDAANKAEADASDALTQATNAATISAQAKAIAEGAVLTAETMRDEAVKDATEAVLSSSELRDEFSAMDKQINDLEGQVTIVTKKASGRYETVDTISGVDKEETVVYYAKDTKTYHYYDYDIPGWAETTNPREAGLSVAIAGLQVETDENSASINSLASWQGTANISMARIEQKADANGAYIQSTVSNMDKYTVGPHSQAYGFTLEQAASILEEGMIYVPTESVTETYEYVEGEATKTYERVFTPGYLYQWGKLTDYPYGWITVDKNYKETEVNTSGPSVYFRSQEPTSVDTTHGYWYANTAEIKDKMGQVTDKYEPYTLYKWDLPYKYKSENGTDVEEYRWVAVATLAGNSSNRAVSQIRQDANSIAFEVTNPQGSFAGMRAELSGTQGIVQQMSKWANNGATVKTETNDNGSAVTITAYSENEETGEVTEQASLVLNVAKNSDGSPTSELSIDADNINFTATADYSVIADNITLRADRLDFGGDGTEEIYIDASHITFDGEATFITSDDLENGETTINGACITTGAIKSQNYVTSNGEEGLKLDLSNGEIDSKNFQLNSEGEITAVNADITGDITATKISTGDGDIGGWKITPNSINKDTVSLYSDNSGFTMPSLLEGSSESSPVVIHAYHDNLIEKTHRNNITTEEGNNIFSYSFTLDSYKVLKSAEISSIDVEPIVEYGEWKSKTEECGVTIDYGSGSADIDTGLDASAYEVVVADVTTTGGDHGYSYNGEPYINADNKWGISIYGGDSVDQTYGTDTVEVKYEYRTKSTVTNEVVESNIEILNNGFEVTGKLSLSMVTTMTVVVGYTYTNNMENAFAVLADGSMYASGANITGRVIAEEGEIGNLTLKNGNLTSSNFNLSTYYDNDTKKSVTSLSFNDGTNNDTTMVSDNYVYSPNVQSQNGTFDTLNVAGLSFIDGLRILDTSLHGYATGFNFDYGGLSQEYEVKVSTYDSYRLQLTITNEKKLAYAKTFLIKYNTDGNTNFSSVYMTIQANASSCISEKLTSFFMPKNAYFEESGTSTLTFIQNSVTLGQIEVKGSLIPMTSDFNLGSERIPWGYTYSSNCTESSDKKVKDNIIDINAEFSTKLINGLSPKSYTFKTAKTPRTHYGFVAQEVEELLNSLGTSTDEVGLVCKSLPNAPDGENNHYSLNYTNLIAPMVSVIQQLSSRIEELENKISELNTLQND